MMPHRELELILMRELASHLRMPIFVVQPNGDLLFYNEPAERLLGLRFDETGLMPAEDWGSRFIPTDKDGQRLTLEDLPLAKAMATRRPDHGAFFIIGADGVQRHIEVTAIPLDSQTGRDIGAAALFWEVP